MTSLSRPPHPPPPHLLPSCLPCVFKLASPSISPMPQPCYFTLPFSVPQPCYFILPFSVPQLTLLLTKYSTLLCPLPHSVGLLNAVICPIPLSPLAHSDIWPKLQSASLCHLPHLSLFALVFPLLCSVLCFILPPALLCPLTHSCHLPPYSLLFVSLQPLQCSTRSSVPFSLGSTLPSASLCPLFHSEFCYTLTSAPLLHSALFPTLPSPSLWLMLHSDRSSTLPSHSLSPMLHSELVPFWPTV